MISTAVTPNFDKVIQFCLSGRECSFRRKRTDMQLIDHRFFPGTSFPVLVICQEHVRDQSPRSGPCTPDGWKRDAGSGTRWFAVDCEAVTGARSGIARYHLEPAAVKRRHIQSLSTRSTKQSRTDAAAGAHSRKRIVPFAAFCPERHFVLALHSAAGRLRSDLRIRSGGRSTSKASERACNG